MSARTFVDALNEGLALNGKGSPRLVSTRGTWRVGFAASAPVEFGLWSTLAEAFVARVPLRLCRLGRCGRLFVPNPIGKGQPAKFCGVGCRRNFHNDTPKARAAKRESARRARTAQRRLKRGRTRKGRRKKGEGKRGPAGAAVR